MGGRKVARRITLGMGIVLVLIAILAALSHYDIGKLSEQATNTVVKWRQSTVVTIPF